MQTETGRGGTKRGVTGRGDRLNKMQLVVQRDKIRTKGEFPHARKAAILLEILFPSHRRWKFQIPSLEKPSHLFPVRDWSTE